MHTDADLMRDTLREAIAAGGELRSTLAALGWGEVVAADPEVAGRLLFTEHGRALARSTVLDEVLLAALDPALAGARGDAPRHAVVLPLPPAQDWRHRPDAAPCGLVLGEPGDGDVLVWPVARGGGYDLVTLGRDEVGLAALDLMDGSLGWLRAVPLAPLPPAGRACDTVAAVAAGRRAVAAEILGACSVALELACAHTSVREQFGRRLATFQAVRHRLADAHIAIVAAQAALDTAWACAAAEEGHGAAEIAKYEAGRAQAVVATQTLQVCGATGLTRDHPLHRHVVRAAVLDGLLGGHRAIEAEIGTRLLTGADLAPVAGLA